MSRWRLFGKRLLYSTVGAVHDIPDGYSDFSNVAFTQFTSWGPTDDGSIKPDIVANGYEVYFNQPYLWNKAVSSRTSQLHENIEGLASPHHQESHLHTLSRFCISFQLPERRLHHYSRATNRCCLSERRNWFRKRKRKSISLSIQRRKIW